MGNETWIVERIEADGHKARSFELSQEKADALYINWCENSKLYKDRSISIIRVYRVEKLVSRYINTESVAHQLQEKSDGDL